MKLLLTMLMVFVTALVCVVILVLPVFGVFVLRSLYLWNKGTCRRCAFGLRVMCNAPGVYTYTCDSCGHHFISPVLWGSN